MRYRAYAGIFGCLIVLAACAPDTRSPEQRARDRAEWADIDCAIGTSFGSIAGSHPLGGRTTSVAEAKQWCRAMRQGTPYVSPNANVAPSYHCTSYDGLTMVCNPR